VPRPISPHGESKLAFEKFCVGTMRYMGSNSFHCVTSPPVTRRSSAKITSRRRTLIPTVLRVALGKQTSRFTNGLRHADGTCIRDYIHILDLAHAHILFLLPPAADFISRHRRRSSVREVIDTCRKITGDKRLKPLKGRADRAIRHD
jgi:UDP-glucose 4-epimerase